MPKKKYRIITSGLIIKVTKKEWESQLVNVKLRKIWFKPAENTYIDNMYYHYNRSGVIDGWIVFDTYEGE